MTSYLDLLIQYSPQVVTFVSALVALISAILARRARKRQEDLIFERLRHDIDRTSLEWGREVIDTLSEAEHLLEYKNLSTTENRRRDLLGKLSSLIDQGPHVFPEPRSGRQGHPQGRSLSRPAPTCA
ncbi:MAG: hypothetical protein AAGA69_11690 [Pseudomonadota bacterium]